MAFLSHHSGNLPLNQKGSGTILWGFPHGSVVKKNKTKQNSPTNVGDSGLIPGSGRSPGQGNGNPLQYSCLGNPIDCSPPGSSLHGIRQTREDPDLIPGSGRSPGEGNGYPLQYSCLENSMDRGAWQATVTESHTQLSN